MAKNNSNRLTTLNPTKICIIIAVIIFLLLFLKGFFVAAYVNGQPISRINVIDQLEKQSGKTTLDGLIAQTLIEQEAEKRHISVSQQDLDSQIATIQKSLEGQGTTLDAALSQQGMTRADLSSQIKVQTLLKKMVGDPAVSEKDIDDYISQNKAQLPANEDAATLRGQVKQQLIQQKQQLAMQNFVQTLKTKANIIYFPTY